MPSMIASRAWNEPRTAIKTPTANVKVSHVSSSRPFLRVTLLSACRTLMGSGKAPINRARSPLP